LKSIPYLFVCFKSTHGLKRVKGQDRLKLRWALSLQVLDISEKMNGFLKMFLQDPFKIGGS